LTSNAKKQRPKSLFGSPYFLHPEMRCTSEITLAPWREWRLLGYPALQYSMPIVIEMTN